MTDFISFSDKCSRVRQRSAVDWFPGHCTCDPAVHYLVLTTRQECNFNDGEHCEGSVVVRFHPPSMTPDIENTGECPPMPCPPDCEDMCLASEQDPDAECHQSGTLNTVYSDGEFSDQLKGYLGSDGGWEGVPWGSATMTSHNEGEEKLETVETSLGSAWGIMGGEAVAIHFIDGHCASGGEYTILQYLPDSERMVLSLYEVDPITRETTWITDDVRDVTPFEPVEIDPPGMNQLYKVKRCDEAA